MGLTGGVKSHRLSGQISPYCEKKTSLALRVLRAYVFFCDQQDNRNYLILLRMRCFVYFRSGRILFAM